MTISAGLLNSKAEIYAENIAKGSMGEAVQSLHLIATVPCRCDLKSGSRDGAPIEQTVQRAKVYISGSWGVTTSHWIKVTGPDGRVFTGQVASVAETGLTGHHTAIDLVSRPLPPQVTA